MKVQKKATEKRKVECTEKDKVECTEKERKASKNSPINFDFGIR